MKPDRRDQVGASERIDLVQLAAELANRGFYVIGELHASPPTDRPEPVARMPPSP
jgi:hypothetical protein